MSETPEDLIRYDVLTQEALKGVIRKVLDEVAVAGLPGEHHFFITFDTTQPGVRLSKRMRERYPESMTIVIQHSFWNLETSDQAFELDLTFNDIRERLRVPFAAIQAFFDPSVKFGLQFDVAPVANAEIVELDRSSPNEGPVLVNSDRSEKKNSGKSSAASVPTAAKKADDDKNETKDNSKKQSGKKADSMDADITSSSEDKGSKKSGNSGEIVSLDSFRKKK